MTDALNTLFMGLLTFASIGVMIFMCGVLLMMFKDALKVMGALAGGLIMLAMTFGLFLAVVRIALWGFALL